MNGGSRIIGLRSGKTSTPAPEVDLVLSELAPEESIELTEAADVDQPHHAVWIVPTLAILISLGWIGTMLWLALPGLPATAPIALTGFIAALCVPPALIGILMLLALRTSTAEARRFGRTAQAMRAEAASLERTIAMLSRAIDANRGKLADQTAALMAMGDGALTKLATISSGVAEQVDLADDRAKKLADAAGGAHSSLNVLLALLPRAHGETADMIRLLDQTGVSASEHAAALAAQLTALADRGREADAVAGGAAQKLAAHITRMEVTSETAGTRMEQVTDSMSTAVDALLERSAHAIA